MTKYLISFPSEALLVTSDDFERASKDSRAVIEAAKAAGVYVFGGGINEAAAPVRITADGTADLELYPGSRLTGGFTVLELPTRDDAVVFARTLYEEWKWSDMFIVPRGEIKTVVKPA